MSEDDAGYIDQLSWGYRTACVLHVANKLDIFTSLAKQPMTAAELCRHCNTKPEMTEKLLIACVAMGLLEKQQERYQNSERSQRYLVRGEPLYQGDIIAHSGAKRDFWRPRRKLYCAKFRFGFEYRV